MSTLGGLVGGILMALTGLALLSVLNEAEFVVVEPVGWFAMVLLALALPALYASERDWFGWPGKIGFALLSIGWVVATLGLTVGTYTMPPTSETGFLVFLLAFLVAVIGMLVFGVAVLRSDGATIPRSAAWLLILALPVGVPFAIAFTTYVMGEGADPWAGPMLFYGLAWVIYARSLRQRRAESPAVEPAGQ
ncbi:hypothetical protein [Halomarina ordinaria]|uniref:DUF998 domain-containing protein n=1 Tax=Halomarina ordinaria TaxID=3033939 RepID=A0ABD5U4B0_9EURY|nr:hypothetical protein [Halomarina sp. PSRA2]